jgi:hypothetical protein
MLGLVIFGNSLGNYFTLGIAGAGDLVMAVPEGLAVAGVLSFGSVVPLVFHWGPSGAQALLVDSASATAAPPATQILEMRAMRCLPKRLLHHVTWRI